MTKSCFVCGRTLRNDDPVVAVVRATYVQLDSEIAYSITRPTECYTLSHEWCADVDGPEEA